MKANTRFRKNKKTADNSVPGRDQRAKLSAHQELLYDVEERLMHLSRQKDLHGLALKEMYQFLRKLNASYTAEHKKLSVMLKACTPPALSFALMTIFCSSPPKNNSVNEVGAAEPPVVA